MNEAEAIAIREKTAPLFSATSHPTVTAILTDGTRVKVRLFRSTAGDICYFRKGSRKRGYYLTDFYNLKDIIPITHHKSTEQKWIDGWKKVRTQLQQSGLWEEVIQEINKALEVGYEKMNLAYQKYWEIHDDQKQVETLAAIHPNLVRTNQDGKTVPNSHLIWTYAKLPKVKKMYFGKYHNQTVLDYISRAMANKQECSADERAGYDVSFQYKPEKNMAWYSEEYRGCSNGHYYLAINSTHALFCEDD